MYEGKPGRMEQLRLLGGQLSLDFVNTVDGRNDPPVLEYLNSYEDLIAWSRRATLFDAPTAQALLRLADQQPAAAIKVFEEAMELRERLYRIFSALAGNEPPSSTDLVALNKDLQETLAHLRVTPKTGGMEFEWIWQGVAENLASPLWPVVRSATEFLTGDELAKLRECPGSHCDWLFVDRSRNHSRRWCNMQTCGNVDKARHFYERQQTARPPKSAR